MTVGIDVPKFLRTDHTSEDHSVGPKQLLRIMYPGHKAPRLFIDFHSPVPLRPL